MHRFSLIQSHYSCISILFDAYGYSWRHDGVSSSSRRAGPHGQGARGGRRRHRLHRSGAAAPALAASGRDRHRGDVVGCHRGAAAAGARPPVERHDHAARRRARSRATPTWCSWRCPTRRPPTSRRGSSTAASASSICQAPSVCAMRRRGRAGIRRPHALPDGAGLRPHRAFIANAIRNARLVANPGCYPTAALLALMPLAAAGLLDADERRHRGREVGRVGRRQDAVRADAFLGGARQPVGLRRVRPSSWRGNRGGTRQRR